MKVYLAGPYAARELLLGYSAELTRIGFTVTAEWLTGEHEATAAVVETREDRAKWARMDLRDVARADLLVAFTAGGARVSSDKGTSGGRHIETGYAMARGKPVVLVGEPENIFHSMDGVTICPDWYEALIELASVLRAHERDMPRAVDKAAS